MDCGDGVQSYGRRRRRDVKETSIADDFVQRPSGVDSSSPDQDVIYYPTPLRKQIHVAAGTKIDEFRDIRIPGAESGGTV